MNCTDKESVNIGQCVVQVVQILPRYVVAIRRVVLTRQKYLADTKQDISLFFTLLWKTLFLASALIFN